MGVATVDTSFPSRRLRFITRMKEEASFLTTGHPFLLKTAVCIILTTCQVM